jgi:chemotaxis response regulator CheB
MTAARIFIADDSAVTRKVLSEALASDPLMEVIGIAADGEKKNANRIS